MQNAIKPNLSGKELESNLPSNQEMGPMFVLQITTTAAVPHTIFLFTQTKHITPKLSTYHLCKLFCILQQTKTFFFISKYQIIFFCPQSASLLLHWPSQENNNKDFRRSIGFLSLQRWVLFLFVSGHRQREREREENGES